MLKEILSYLNNLINCSKYVYNMRTPFNFYLNTKIFLNAILYVYYFNIIRITSIKVRVISLMFSRHMVPLQPWLNYRQTHELDHF